MEVKCICIFLLIYYIFCSNSISCFIHQLLPVKRIIIDWGWEEFQLVSASWKLLFSRWWWIIQLLLQLTGNKLLSWLMKVLVQHQSCRQLWVIKEITIFSAAICVCLRSLCCGILCLTGKSPVLSPHHNVQYLEYLDLFQVRLSCDGLVMRPRSCFSTPAAPWEGSNALPGQTRQYFYLRLDEFYVCISICCCCSSTFCL